MENESLVGTLPFLLCVTFTHFDIDPKTISCAAQIQTQNKRQTQGTADL